jgi:phosphatidylserine/phosphatidylglycerophosphate/cardiolipin synthase-like enzyme
MAKFLSTTGTNYHLEELIKGASDRLILISPFLKLNDRMKELLADKNRLKIDVRIVYGKSELQPQEIEWLRGLTYIRTSFCKNLHAKCYMNEEMCIITSLNLYEFSQVNNNEMGILIQRSDDGQLYKDAYEEAQRIIRISDEVRISLERVASSEPEPVTTLSPDAVNTEGEAAGGDKVPSSKLAQKFGLKTAQLLDRATELGYLMQQGDKHALTPKGEQAGVEFVAKSRFGPYFLWPQDLVLG